MCPSCWGSNGHIADRIEDNVDSGKGKFRVGDSYLEKIAESIGIYKILVVKW